MTDPGSENSKTATMAKDTFALITGASGGIGACFARALAARGRHLVLVARSKDKLDSIKSEIAAKHSLRIEIVCQDLSEEGAAQRLAATLNDRGIVAVVEVGLRAFERGRSLVVTRFLNRLMIFAQRLAPRRLAARMAGDMFKPKMPNAGK